MNIFDNIFMAVVGAAAGFGVSGGVFTTLIAIGLVPRFAGKTHTADHIFLYEEMVVCGTLFGGLVTVFFPFIRLHEWLGDSLTRSGAFYEGLSVGRWYPVLGTFVLVVFGLFAGIFVGCLALAIAEMLDSIPIFARRSGFRQGIGIAILCMAVGKTVGSLIYFIKEIFAYGGV